jgi:predicted GNAT family acetyltransferase
VFHIYDLLYIFKPPGIIQHSLPEKNKYTNFKNIETILFSELSEFKKTRLVQFIRSNYLQNKENIFSPQSENILPYFTGHNTKTFVSFYNEDNIMNDLKTGNIITDKKVIGIMTSRPIYIIIHENNKQNTLYAYYVDYLCVDKMFRKKGIASQMIQTHEYNQRHLNKNIVVSLFKREDELTAIVPLCVYSTYGFSVNKWTKPHDLHASYTLLEINNQNFHFLFDFMKQNSNQFSVVIYTEVTNMIELIKTKNMFIYVILAENKIISAYFYRKSCTFIEKNMEVLSCFASINNTEDNLFIQGFKISFWKIAAENMFGFSAIEEISHNHIIIENLKQKTTPMIISPTAYFFYNFAYTTLSSEKVFIIN